jgi:hypothetical protein
MEVIKDRDFWVKLEALRELLQPIDECLRMSESGKSHLGHVLNRWADILNTLTTKSIEHDELVAFISASGSFMQHYHKQVLPIHVAVLSHAGNNAQQHRKRVRPHPPPI